MSKLELKVDLSGTFEEFLLTNQQRQLMTAVVLQSTVDLFTESWRKSARRRLNSTRANYLRGIIQVDRGPMKKAVVLTGKFNNMVENGFNSFDMKEGFSRSKKRKLSKNGGWYLTIPFRFATPNALGENEAFSGGIMPTEIYNIIKNAKPTKIANNGMKIQSGKPIKFGDIPKSSNLQIPKTSKSGYKHKSSIYEGITKEQKTYENASQSQYVSFRRVSSKSDPKSFIHSGIKAYNLAESAFRETDFETNINNIVDKMLSNV